MAERLFEVMREPRPGPLAASLLRLEPLVNERAPDVVTFSGGVAEYVLGRETRRFDDLGPALAAAIRERVAAWEPRLEPPARFFRRPGGAGHFFFRIEALDLASAHRVV